MSLWGLKAALQIVPDCSSCSIIYFYTFSHYIHITDSRPYNTVTTSISRYLVKNIVIFDFIHIPEPYLLSHINVYCIILNMWYWKKHWSTDTFENFTVFTLCMLFNYDVDVFHRIPEPELFHVANQHLDWYKRTSHSEITRHNIYLYSLELYFVPFTQRKASHHWCTWPLGTQRINYCEKQP